MIRTGLFLIPALCLAHTSWAEQPKDPDYRDVVRMAAELTDTERVKRLDQIGFERNDGHLDWMRNALFSEWAKRDLDAALTYFKKHQRRISGGQGVLYALFTGARPKDPEKALDLLRRWAEDPRFRPLKAPRYRMASDRAEWVQHAYQRLFAELAAIDPERAWTNLPGREPDRPEDAEPLNHNAMASANYSYVSMVDGFFSGLSDTAAVRKYLERFGPVGGPGTEHLGIRIAKAWMVHDIKAAQAWAPPARNDPLVANMYPGVDSSAAHRWAMEYPHEAVKAIRDHVLPAWNLNMAEAALSADAHLAETLTPILLPPKAGLQPGSWSPLFTAYRANAELGGLDRFPEVGRKNRPGDYAARYQSFLQAIEQVGYSDDTRLEIHERLNRAFKK
ncbi:MAG: hypothetical protein AAF492_14800 [Verrucomicrobiota bacterium]